MIVYFIYIFFFVRMKTAVIKYSSWNKRCMALCDISLYIDAFRKMLRCHTDLLFILSWISLSQIWLEDSLFWYTVLHDLSKLFNLFLVVNWWYILLDILPHVAKFIRWILVVRELILLIHNYTMGSTQFIFICKDVESLHSSIHIYHSHYSTC